MGRKTSNRTILLWIVASLFVLVIVGLISEPSQEGKVKRQSERDRLVEQQLEQDRVVSPPPERHKSRLSEKEQTEKNLEDLRKYYRRKDRERNLRQWIQFNALLEEEMKR